MENQLLYELYRTYADEIALYLYSLCKDRSVAEDLLQEVFLKAMLSLPSDHANFRAWLYRVARNLCYNEMRGRKREVPAEPVDVESTLCEGQRGSGCGTPQTPQTPLEQLLEREKTDRLYEAILELPPVPSSVIVMQYFGELSQKEIAEVLGISPGNVRVIACRAREQLRRSMESYEGGERDEISGDR